MEQINLKLAPNLKEAAERYVENFGFRNIQELVSEALREKIFERNDYDESIAKKEIELIDSLIIKSVKNKKVVSEQELNKTLRK